MQICLFSAQHIFKLQNLQLNITVTLIKLRNIFLTSTVQTPPMHETGHHMTPRYKCMGMLHDHV
jgi:hypothetical protein